MNKKILLLIPESRKNPMTDSLLYKQIVRFFEEEKIRDKFEIAFITIESGIMNQESVKNEKHNSLFMVPNSKSLPPQRFRSGMSWINKKQIEQMAENIVEYIKTLKHENIKTIAYVRGAYLEAVRIANRNLELVTRNSYKDNEKLQVTDYKLRITEFFSDDELAQLKKKGIMWMKVGLRMPTAFIAFRMKIKEFVKECEREPKQLKLPF